MAIGVGLAVGGCQSPATTATPPQKTGEGPNDPNVKTDEAKGQKTVDVSQDPEANPDGIDLVPVGQGGGPQDEPTDKPAAPTAQPIAKKPVAKPKSVPTATTPPPAASTNPPTWVPPPLPSGWVWPFPATSAKPAPSTTTTTVPKTSTGKTDAGPAPSVWTLPPFGGS